MRDLTKIYLVSLCIQNRVRISPGLEEALLQKYFKDSMDLGFYKPYEFGFQNNSPLSIEQMIEKITWSNDG